MSERTLPDRPVTPPGSKSPFRQVTPKTPELRGRLSIELATTMDNKPAQESHFELHTPEDIDSMPEQAARDTLKIAMRKMRTLENDIRQSKLQAAHFRFNYQMMLAEQEERTKRSEVEYQLLSSSQELLYNKFSRSEEEERTFRNRHLKAKKRVAELMDDNRRQQLSIEHLKQAMSTGSNFGLRSSTSNSQSSQHQMDGGLEVLSDAAGMAQKRDLDQSSGNESQMTPSTHLLSPVAFEEQVPLPHLPTRAAKRRRESEISLNGSHARRDETMGRRSTFNSSGSLNMAAPMTPKSPRRTTTKLEPSALS